MMFFDNMVRSTTQMKELIRDVLEFSTIGKELKAPECIDLNEVLANVRIDLELVIQEKQAVVQSGRLPSVLGDGYQLQQLFGNLLSNSLKYSKADVPPVINIKAVPGTDGMAEIVFEDNGIGFEEEYTEKIFKIFQRLHGRDQYSGTGIGLAICKRVAELHGGRLEGKGAPGEGAVFTLTLPFVEP
jgi:signal transduction histidine kinase